MNFLQKITITIIILSLYYFIGSFTHAQISQSCDLLPTNGTNISIQNKTSLASACAKTEKIAGYEGSPVSYSRIIEPIAGQHGQIEKSTILEKYGNAFSQNTIFPFISNYIPVAGNNITGIIITQAKNGVFISGAWNRSSIATQLKFIAQYRKVVFRDTATNGYVQCNFYYNPVVGSNYSSNLYSRINNPTQQLEICSNYYVAFCGDGVVDNTTKPGDSDSTDGKAGILVDGSIVRWTAGSLPNEVCDDKLAPGGCKDDCTGYEGPAGCTLTASYTNGTLNVNWSALDTTSSATLTSNPSLNGFPQAVNTAAGSQSFSQQLANGNYTFTLSGANRCETSLNVQLPVCSQSFTITGTANNRSFTCYGSNNSGYVLNILQGTTPFYTNTGNSIQPSYTRNLNNLNEGSYSATCTVFGSLGSVNCAPIPFQIGGAQALLTGSKTLIDSTKTYAPGQLVGYRVEVKNIGSGVASDVRLEDILPNGITLQSYYFSGPAPVNFATGMQGGNVVISYTGFSLAPDQSAILFLTGMIKNETTACQQAMNNAFIYTGNSTVPAFNVSALFSCDDGIVFTKTSTKTTYYQNEQIGFTLSLRNNGSQPISGIVVQDTWPSCMVPGNFTSNPLQCTYNNGIRTCPNELLPGQVLNINFSATANSCGLGTFTNTAKADFLWNGNQLQRTGAVNFALIEEPRTHVAIEKKIVRYGTKSGDPIEFEITCRNDGNQNTTFILVDYWPDNVEFISSDVIASNIQGSNEYRWSINLGPNQQRTIKLYGKLR